MRRKVDVNTKSVVARRKHFQLVSLGNSVYQCQVSAAQALTSLSFPGGQLELVICHTILRITPVSACPKPLS